MPCKRHPGHEAEFVVGFGNARGRAVSFVCRDCEGQSAEWVPLPSVVASFEEEVNALPCLEKLRAGLSEVCG